MSTRLLVILCIAFLFAQIAVTALSQVPDKTSKQVVPCPNSPGPRPAASADSDVKPRTGTFKGVVKFIGTVPSQKLVIKKDDPTLKPEDRAICAAEDYYSEELIVNENAGNGVANVFVYLEKIPVGYTPSPAPDEPFILDAKACRYVPHAFLLRCDQTFKIKSLDAIPHNAHVLTIRNTRFSELNGVRDAEGFIRTRTFSKPESRPLPVRCDLHSWMKAYYLLVEHDLAAVTDADGQFIIKGLPPGRHIFTVWHERPGFLKKELPIEIKIDAVTETTLSYDARDFIESK